MKRRSARRQTKLRRAPGVALFFCFWPLLAASAGCHNQRPQSHDDPETATLAYWAQQPSASRVISGDYAALWSAVDEARRRFGFDAATTDYRGGLLTTEPKVSPQFFEIWHHELRSAEDVAQSSLATIRRRLRFEFSRVGEGKFTVEVRVLVERRSLAERRITSAIDYRGTLGPGRQQQFGPASAAAGPGSYWYAIGRDEDLERSLANRIAQRVK